MHHRAAQVRRSAANLILYNVFSKYAFSCSFYAKIRSQFLAVCKIRAQRSAYYGARSHQDASSSYQKSWDNIPIPAGAKNIVQVFRQDLCGISHRASYSLCHLDWPCQTFLCFASACQIPQVPGLPLTAGLQGKTRRTAGSSPCRFQAQPSWNQEMRNRDTPSAPLLTARDTRCRRYRRPPSCPSWRCSRPPPWKILSLLQNGDLRINEFHPALLSIASIIARLRLSSVTTARISSISILATSSFLRSPDTMLS